jgi:hypothetical protein
VGKFLLRARRSLSLVLMDILFFGGLVVVGIYFVLECVLTVVTMVAQSFPGRPFFFLTHFVIIFSFALS